MIQIEIGFMNLLFLLSLVRRPAAWLSGGRPCRRRFFSMFVKSEKERRKDKKQLSLKKDCE